MKRRTTSVEAPVAHLVGPGRIKVINGKLAFASTEHPPLRLHPNHLRILCCYGRISLTDEALRLLFKHNIDVAWLTPAGNHCRGRIVRADGASTGLRMLQHAVLREEDHRLDLARHIVSLKLGSQIHAARHYQRHGAAGGADTLRQLRRLESQAWRAHDLDTLLGIEGAGSSAWFALVGQVIRPPFAFSRRVRRPPTDPVNALLSLGYTWLLNRTIAACDARGLETGLGSLHAYRPGRPSLACDLMEPLRVPAVDRWVIQTLNESRLQPEDFVDASGGYRLRPDRFAAVLLGWEQFWYNQRIDKRLQTVLEDVVRRIRQAAHPRADPGTAGAAGRICKPLQL